MASSQTICFKLDQHRRYFPPFLHQSPTLSHMHTSGSREVKVTFLNQLPSHLFNWENKWSHVSSADPKLYLELGCQVDQWYAWPLMDSSIWVHFARMLPFEKVSSRAEPLKTWTFSVWLCPSNKYTKAIQGSFFLLWPRGEIPHFFVARC